MDSRQVTNPNKALVVLCMSSFLAPFMGASINLALLDISNAFSLDAVMLTQVSMAYLISTAIFQVPFARLADLVGRRKIFNIGVLLFAICAVLCAFAPSGEALILFRFLDGVGSAMLFSTSMAILTSVIPANKRGKALGINTAVVYSALAVGPFVGGLLTHYWGWQSIFLVGAGIAFLLLVLSQFFLKGEWIEAKGEKFDYVGSMLYGVGVFGVLFGFTKLPYIEGICWIVAGIFTLIWFIYYEKRCKFPVLNIKLFSHNRTFTLSSLAALINYAANSAIAFMLSLYLQYVRGFDAHYAGLILISQACVQAICTLFAGHLSDKIAPSRLATLGMIISVIGLIGLVFISSETPIYVVVACLLLLGIGFGIFSSPNTNMIMSAVDKKNYGQASATMGTVRLIGQALSMGIAGMAIALQVGSRKIEPLVFPQFLQSMHITFIICVALCVVGVYASAQRRKL